VAVALPAYGVDEALPEAEIALSRTAACGFRAWPDVGSQPF
jgi:hypothetical protein